MRTRSKIISGGVTEGGPIWHTKTGLAPYLQPNESISVFNGGTSTMIDDPKGRGWKPVSHIQTTEFANIDTKCRWRPLGGSWNEDAGPNAYWYAWSPAAPQHMPLSAYDLEYPKTTQQLLSDAYAKFLNGNEVNNLLNVWESPQLASSMSSLWTTMKLPTVQKALLRKVSGVTRDVELSTLKRLRSPLSKDGKDILKSIPGNFLAYSFGIAPLLSDMLKVEKAAATFVADVKSSVKRAGQEATSRSLTIAKDIADTIQLSSHRIYGDASSGKVVSVKGINTIPFNSKKLREVDYVIRRWGSPGPASIAWERIPFSFVVDWFLDTSVLFASLDNLLTGGTKRVTGQMLTTTTTYSSSMVHYQPSYECDIVDDDQIVASQVSKVYVREILSGTPPLVSWKGRFGKKQMALSAALLYQQVAKRA